MEVLYFMQNLVEIERCTSAWEDESDVFTSRNGRKQILSGVCVYGPKTLKIWNFTNILAPKDRIPCEFLTNIFFAYNSLATTFWRDLSVTVKLMKLTHIARCRIHTHTPSFCLTSHCIFAAVAAVTVNSSSLIAVYTSFIVSLVRYCSAADHWRLDNFLKHCKNFFCTINVGNILWCRWQHVWQCTKTYWSCPVDVLLEQLNVHYHLRACSNSTKLINKTISLNDRDFLVRLPYKYCY